MCTNLCAPWGRVTAPKGFYFFLKFFIRVGAVATAPTHRANEIFFLSFFLCCVGAGIIFVTAATNAPQKKKNFPSQLALGWLRPPERVFVGAVFGEPPGCVRG